MTGLYVKLDTNWPDHPKVIAAGLNGAGLHAIASCLAKRLGYDGIVHRSQLLRYDGVTPELIDRVVDCGLFDAVDNDRIAVHDWNDYNPTRLAIGGESGARSSDGRRGNHKRWRHGGDFIACQTCNPPNEQVTRLGDRPPIAPDIAPRSPRIARDRDRDIYSDTVAAAHVRAVENTSRIKALHAEPPPPLEITAQGIAAARDATHHRETAP